MLAMLETSARLLRLLSLLQVPRAWSGPELARRLEVSTRTVRKDVDRLRSLGYPVDSTPGVDGGYRLAAGAQVPPLLLDDDEAVAVAIGLGGAAVSSVAGIAETSFRALAKLEQVLPERLRRRVDGLRNTMVAIADDVPSVDATVLAALGGAARDHRRLRFYYRSHDGGRSLRDTEPHWLVQANRRWYLVAWDVERKGWRTFRVDRIGSPFPLGPRFRPREAPGGDVAGYVARGIATAPLRYRATARVHASADVLAGYVWPDWGVIEPIDERTCLFHTGGQSLDTIVLLLGTLGVDFEVVEPPELVEHLRSTGERYLRAASAIGSRGGS
jgi:predicted DNA-binding transcriptional regulator YafY